MNTTTAPRRVMVVEDDPKIAQLLVDYLHSDGFAVDAVDDGAVALESLKRAVPVVLVLDLMLPGLDGLSVCREVRRFSDVPILMLTARVDEVDRLIGLDSGADDYVCKPFSPREVTARVRALVRRSEGRLTGIDTPWRIDDDALRILWRGQVVPLTALEFRLLRPLLLHPGRVYSRQQLLDAVHSEWRDVSDRAVDSHVKNIRRKLLALDSGFNGLASVYGVGYRFDAP